MLACSELQMPVNGQKGQKSQLSMYMQTALDSKSRGQEAHWL